MALEEFLQRWAGYCLTGLTDEQGLVFIYGPAASGKSRFCEALRHAWGSYGQTAPQELLLAAKYDRHPTELARLQSARLVISAETQEGRSWDEARVKMLTGGDRVTARYMRGDFFEFNPSMKLLIHGNYRPRLRNPDPAMRRRMMIVPFEHTIPEAERDESLFQKLEAEAAGILSWAIEGCQRWNEDRLKPPSCVVQATDMYFTAEDIVQRWIDEQCTLADYCEATRSLLWQSWSAWCAGNGEHPGTQRRLVSELERREFQPVKIMGTRSFRGIGVKAAVDADVRSN